MAAVPARQTAVGAVTHFGENRPYGALISYWTVGGQTGMGPGSYQVTVRVAGEERTATVEVLPDPRKVGVDFFITP